MGTCASYSKCKECGFFSNKTFGKVETDGFHKRCRSCIECGKKFYYLNNVPFYVDCKTKRHYPECAPKFTQYTYAVLFSGPSNEPDIR